MKDARLRLACAGMHPDRVRGLLAAFGDAERVLHAIERGNVNVSDHVAEAAAVDAAARWEQVKALGASLLFHGDPNYPGHLGRYEDAPDVLFVRGELPPGPGVAIVGTRRCTAYGRELARAYGRAAAEAGWPVVSGLARGIDGEAHRGVVDGEGVGVVALGCGIDVVYPREHRGLGRQILDGGGAIVTEYPPGSPPDGWRFPPRNRIIAGLAAAVVVVEAARTGGALITAIKAAEYGIPVFAMPGDVDRRSSEGCNLLIRDGAFPVLDPDDLVEELALVGELKAPNRQSSPPLVPN
jgi:DNA processing protein